MKIKANEYLFYKWKNLGFKIELLNSIVQNDMEIDKRNIAEWYDECCELNENLEVLIDETLKYLNKDKV